MSWSGARFHRSESSYVPTTEEIFSHISMRIKNIRQLIESPIVGVKEIFLINANLYNLQKAIANQPNEPRYAEIKENQFREVYDLQLRAEKLQESIVQLKLIKSDRLAKTSHQKKLLVNKAHEKVNVTMPEDILICVYQFLTASDMAKGSSVSQFFNRVLCDIPLSDSLIFLSDNLVLKLADFKPPPTLGEFYQARKQSIKDSSFFSFYETKLKKIPVFLQAILIARLEKEKAVENDDEDAHASNVLPLPGR